MTAVPRTSPESPIILSQGHHTTVSCRRPMDIPIQNFQIFVIPIKNSNRCVKQPNGHIFVDSPSTRRRNSTWKVRGNYIDFERRIHVEIMTSIRRGYFDVDSTFKIDEISMNSPRRFFYVFSTSNRRNFCTHCFHSIIF